MNFEKASYKKPNFAPPNIQALHLNEMLISYEQKEMLYLENLHMYPANEKMADIISSIFDVSCNNIIIDNGSSEILKNIFLIISSDLDKRAVLLPNPSWSFYLSFMEFLGISFHTFDLDMSEKEFSYRKIAIQEKINLCDVGYVFICSPNNPTGNSIDIDDFLDLVISNPNKTFILDRAYFGFVDSDFDRKLTSRLSDLENMIIIYSLSKFYGLASVRTGFCLSHQKNIQKIKNLTPSFGISNISCDIVANRMLDKNYFRYIKEKYAHICYYIAEKNFKNFTIYKTEANFFLIEVHKHNKDYIYQSLLSSGFLVKIEEIFSKIFLRTTIADIEVMKKFFKILSKIDNQ